MKPKMAQVHLQLSELYEHTGDPEKSLLHYKRFHELHEEVERGDSARKLADAKLIFEAEQTRKENVISLSPINRAIEHHLLRKVTQRRRLAAVGAADASVPA
ncbi:MAG: hypothetical protein ABSG61_01380 [Gemmatimonadales bacterium]